ELLGHGAEVNVKAKLPVWASNITSCSGPLYLAAVYGHLDCFRLLLLHGADPDYNCTDQRLLARVSRPRTLLEICLHHNCEPEYIQLLIDFGANIYLPSLSLDLNSQYDKGTALLVQARDLAYPPAHNENSSAPISQGENLMDITKIFSLLQPDDEEDTNTGEKQALNQAVYNNDSYTLDQLLCQERYKRFINSRSGWGVPGTPLRLAAAYGHLSCLQVLLAHGADVDSLDVKAQTPLFTAVSHGHLDCVRVLLEAGACPGGSIYNNCSPVLTAARD
ncbi:PREDICTED: ankyrin repeat and SOCS box protein 12, partial [Bison bison bison]|uniref:Ankyrin repeat and SOCS box protein 12 n=1 Tax=Bison bison bison TaxID=43346 RepID=A0A6P3IFK8_BISBB